MILHNTLQSEHRRLSYRHGQDNLLLYFDIDDKTQSDKGLDRATIYRIIIDFVIYTTPINHSILIMITKFAVIVKT